MRYTTVLKMEYLFSGPHALDTRQTDTFHSWECHNDFSFKDDGDKLTLLQCNICSNHATSIRREALLRGISGVILKGVLSYVDGVTYIHKSNVLRHVQSGSLHDWAKKKFCQPSPDIAITNTTDGRYNESNLFFLNKLNE